MIPCTNHIDSLDAAVAVCAGMRDDAPPVDAPGRVGRLLDTLDAAARVVKELGADPVLRRMVDVFELMPSEDRDVVLGALEREVYARRLSRATEEATGQAMHPNPHARVYLRSHESPVPRELLERDEMMFAMLNALRVTPILAVEPIHTQWIAATREALGHLEPATLTVVRSLLADVLALLDEPSGGET